VICTRAFFRHEAASATRPPPESKRSDLTCDFWIGEAARSEPACSEVRFGESQNRDRSGMSDLLYRTSGA